MDGFNLSDADKSLSALVDRTEAGETIDILRDGRLVAKLVPVEPPVDKLKRRVDIEALRRHLEQMPMQHHSAGEFIRHMRDTDRY
ncbi:type II toxin-antitoxin system prevent-host-death family antitoxin [Blastomonas sp.]|uniref:type II toxin-antitoxin system Phd/YefM family antitoxin n=1 Tax=Blastomonas sp. TaxID=1909299 RepID=UPI00260B52DB|nr:type II toxin-antitoxin system prevent-host-death family antitoxin [Blastomonas sp.]MDM7954983.1 type II toxin-antitoxin system prevent-host-death family antitoxin [Blastomonas sp.]